MIQIDWEIRQVSLFTTYTDIKYLKTLLLIFTSAQIVCGIIRTALNIPLTTSINRAVAGVFRSRDMLGWGFKNLLPITPELIAVARRARQ